MVAWFAPHAKTYSIEQVQTSDA